MDAARFKTGCGRARNRSNIAARGNRIRARGPADGDGQQETGCKPDPGTAGETEEQRGHAEGSGRKRPHAGGADRLLKNTSPRISKSHNQRPAGERHVVGGEPAHSVL